MKLFLKGTKCHTEKCPVDKRNFAPGQHGRDRKVKIVGYGLQLREKQKAKRIYFTLESQFREYYEKANRSSGVTGGILLQQLERRLDNVAYRLGFAVLAMLAGSEVTLFNGALVGKTLGPFEK